MAKDKTAKSDPMLAALINKLPATGEPWPLAQRVEWLNMIAMSFNMVFGQAEPIHIGTTRVNYTRDAVMMAREASDLVSKIVLDTARPVVAKPNPPRFFIDKQGYARKDPGGIRIMPGNIDAGEVLFDDRGEHGDLATITWSDDSQGVLGLQLDISATPDQAKAV